MHLKNKKIVVIGMGKTGIATAKFLGSQGARVIAIDEKLPDQWGAGYEQIAQQPWLKTGIYDPAILAGVDMVIPSPGVPPSNNILSAALRQNIEVISEVELASRFLRVPLIAVTGTNGKTTTTTLLSEIFRKSGKKVFVGGNIGNPLIEYADTLQTDDFIIAEISSFQLQWVQKFHPFVAILLNVTCDHTDYHGSFAEYLRIKSRVFSNQVAADFAILNAGDPEQESITSGVHAEICRFSTTKELERGIYLKDDIAVCKLFDGSEEQYPVGMIKIPGLHNVENVMAAVMAARLCGCRRDDIIAAVADFHGLPHRIEFAGVKDGIKFYDDSKGTNVGSVMRALGTFSEPVILLLGGRDKDGDFETLQPQLKEKAKKVILFGEARDRISALIGEAVPAEKKKTLQEAIISAYQAAESGDVVLLSPGCASFDEFRNYKERGNFFKEALRNL